MVENKEGRKQYEKQYKADNAERIKQWQKSESRIASVKRSSIKSIAKGKASWIVMMSRMRAWNRIAKWDDELTDFACREAHELARMRDKCTSIKWSVDHIVPLKGKRVSGLHTWNNLQVIPLQSNRLKSAKFEV
jgi:5-methylcytosine-specific restriction endonuclease McrA